jgi:hypothetical protein
MSIFDKHFWQTMETGVICEIACESAIQRANRTPQQLAAESARKEKVSAVVGFVFLAIAISAGVNSCHQHYPDAFKTIRTPALRPELPQPTPARGLHADKII